MFRFGATRPHGERLNFEPVAIAVRSASDRPGSAEPIARPRSRASGPIGRVRELASVDRKASASDALREPRPETLKLGDPLVDPLRPLDGETRPILARRDAIRRKVGEFRANLVERQPNPLRKNDEGDPA